MKVNERIRTLAVFCLLLSMGAVTRAEKIQQIHPTGYVTDLAGIIQPQAKAQLEAMCTELEQKTGAQMAIVTVKSLEGDEIEPYAANLYKQLGVGRKKEDNGVLFLVAPNERKYRVEVGYGLEPVITDARAGDAGRVLVPYFRSGDYSGGITAAAARLANFVADSKGTTLTGLPQVLPVRHGREEDFGSTGLWILLGIILLFFLMARRGRSSGISGPRGGMGSGWWIGPVIGATMGGGWGGGSRGGWRSRGGWGGGGGGFGGFGGGMSGGGGASGSW